MGRLAQVTASAGGTVTRFAYVGLQMVAEAGASGTAPLRRYVYALASPGAGAGAGPGLDSPIVWYEGTDTCPPSPGAGAGGCDRRFLLADERGSIVSVADSTGTVLAINTYDEFGIPASTNVGRFQFTGQAWLPEAGLFYYKTRMYSPTLGRFLQTDPIGYADGLNWYNYVGGDPVNAVDPLGLQDDPRTGGAVPTPICPPTDTCGPDITVKGACRGRSCDGSVDAGPIGLVSFGSDGGRGRGGDGGGNGGTAAVLPAQRQPRPRQPPRRPRPRPQISRCSAYAKLGEGLAFAGGVNLAAGVALDVTGLGAPVGVILNVIGTGEALAGGALTLYGDVFCEASG